MNGLTSREAEILDYISKGHTNVEISDFLKISENTVKVHISNLYKKLNVTNRTEAALHYKNDMVSIEYENKIFYIKPLLILDLFSYDAPDCSNTFKNEYFTTQLQDKLLVGLANRNIFSIFKDTASIPKDIDNMNGYRISGSILKTSDKVDITVYLESYPKQLHIWSHIFHESINDYDLDLIINKITASLMHNLISKESSTSLELEVKERNIFQSILLGFHLSSLADSNLLLKAQNLFDSILTLTPCHIHALYGRGVVSYILIMTGLSKNPSTDYLILKNCCTNIKEISKNCVEYWFIRGLIALLDQDVKGAVILFENALRLDLSRQETLLMLAQLYTALGDYSNAKLYLDKTILLCPDFQYKGRNLLATSIIYFGLRQYEDAIKFLEENFYMQEKNIFSSLLYICSLYYAGHTQKACDLSKDITLSRQYIKRIFSLSNDDILTRLLTAFKHAGITIT